LQNDGKTNLCLFRLNFVFFLSIFCNRSIRDNNGLNECTEAECRMKLLDQNNDENLSTKEVFSLNVHLTDHTGTLTNVKLGDDIARKMLKCSVCSDGSERQKFSFS
jgi:hypothetical protein